IYIGDKTSGLTLLKTYGPTSSLGLLYSAVTDYLGFITNSDEYKIMGLAAYGDGDKYKAILDEIVVLGDEGSVEIKHLIPPKIESPKDRETYRYFKRWLSTQVFPERKSGDPVENLHKDFTAALQTKLNDAMSHVVCYWQQQTNINNLCMAGGVALNCVANAYIAQQKLFEKIYIAPAAADDGTSIGSALVLMRQMGDKIDPAHYIDMPFYGPEIESSECSQLIKDYALNLDIVSDDELVDVVAGAIVEGKIVAWAQGRMEFGPRALGHRSILADPRKYEMRNRLNIITKQRESFRPFAPIVKEEALGKYFEVVDSVVYKHMLVNVNVKDKYRGNLQAITHIDGTARVQSVSKKDLPILWKLLDRIEQQLSIPVLLNTSFNLKTMPIVCYDKDAIKAFIDSDIDILVINNSIIRK
ncbi:MAG: carbamoyltransferase C-terminal domain-containing protein, partial [Candidatus Uhrbacteria bacterium]|nr:carbamoyltransferase C-terminal domain-containing protein [Candidatus Uhrbacteria bacterium]